MRPGSNLADNYGTSRPVIITPGRHKFVFNMCLHFVPFLRVGCCLLVE